MKKNVGLIKYITHLLEEDATLTAEVREGLEKILKALQQPKTLTRAQLIEFAEFLAALISVIHHHT